MQMLNFVRAKKYQNTIQYFQYLNIHFHNLNKKGFCLVDE